MLTLAQGNVDAFCSHVKSGQEQEGGAQGTLLRTSRPPIAHSIYMNPVMRSER